MEVNSSYKIAHEISNVLSQELQVQLRCGICCSTVKQPIIPSCNHSFCKDCLYQCFQRKNTIECPICRLSIKKRSSVVSDNLQALTDAYLQLARNFKRDVKEHAISIPKEEAFMESQAIISTQNMESPLRSFQLESKFAVPAGKARNKRRNPEAELAIARASKMPRLTSVKEEIVENRKSAVALNTKTDADEDDEEILLFDDPPKLAAESKPLLEFGFPVIPRKNVKEEVTTPQGRANLDKQHLSTTPTEKKPGKMIEENVARLKKLLQRKPWPSPKMNNMDFFTALNTVDGKVTPPTKTQERVLSLIRKPSSPSVTKTVSSSTKISPLQSKKVASPEKRIKASPGKLANIKIEGDVQSRDSSTQILSVSPTMSNVKQKTPVKLGDTTKVKVDEQSKCSTPHLSDVTSTRQTYRKRKSSSLVDIPSTSSKFDGLLDAVEKLKGSSGISSIDAVLELVPGLVSILLKDQDRLIEILDLNVRKSDADPICSKCKGSSDFDAIELQNGIPTNSRSMDSPPNKMDSSPKAAPQQSTSLGNDVIILDDTASMSVTNSGSSKTSAALVSIGGNHDKENCSADSSFATPTHSSNTGYRARLGCYIVEPTIQKPDRMVIVATRLQCKDDEVLLHEFVIRFPDVSVVEEVTEECTHLVLFNSKDRTFYQRSLHFVSAIAYECELLNRDWVLQSVRAGKLQRTHKFTIATDHGYPGEEPSWIRRRFGPPLLQGWKFYLPMSMADSNLVPRKALIDIIEASGGTIITNNLSEIKAPDCRIVFAPHSDQVAEARRFEQRFKVPVITADWILKAVAEWSVPKSINSHRVYSCGNVR